MSVSRNCSATAIGWLKLRSWNGVAQHFFVDIFEIIQPKFAVLKVKKIYKNAQISLKMQPKLSSFKTYFEQSFLWLKKLRWRKRKPSQILGLFGNFQACKSCPVHKCDPIYTPISRRFSSSNRRTFQSQCWAWNQPLHHSLGKLHRVAILVAFLRRFLYSVKIIPIAMNLNDSDTAHKIN